MKVEKIIAGDTSAAVLFSCLVVFTNGCGDQSSAFEKSARRFCATMETCDPVKYRLVSENVGGCVGWVSMSIDGKEQPCIDARTAEYSCYSDLNCADFDWILALQPGDDCYAEHHDASEICANDPGAL